MKYILFFLSLFVSVAPISARTIEINSFTPQPFDLTASTKQKIDLNGIPGALVKITLPEGISELKIEGNLIEQTSDGSEIHAYLTSGTKSIIIKIKGCPPYVLTFSQYGVYRLLSKQVYTLDIKTSSSLVSNTETMTSAPRIHDLLDNSNDEDPIDNMVNEANELYSNGKYIEAIPLLKKAAALGHVEALLSLGLLYEKGIGTKDNWILKPSAIEAFYNVQYAAQQGYAPAQKALYRYYLIGVGVDADKSRAEVWKAAYENNVKKSDSESGADTVFRAVEQMAEYPGGGKKLLKDLGQRLRYPESAQANELQGTVHVQFIVKKDGTIDNIKIQKTSIYKIIESKNRNGEIISKKLQIPEGDKALENAVIEAVKGLKKFYPGKNNGVPCNSYFAVPVTFKLGGS